MRVLMLMVANSHVMMQKYSSLQILDGDFSCFPSVKVENWMEQITWKWEWKILLGEAKYEIWPYPPKSQSSTFARDIVQ